MNNKLILELLEEIIQVESFKDAVLKKEDQTLSGDGWTLFHLKSLRGLIQDSGDN